MTTFNYFIHTLLQRVVVLMLARIGDAMELCKRTNERIWNTNTSRIRRVVESTHVMVSDMRQCPIRVGSDISIHLYNTCRTPKIGIIIFFYFDTFRPASNTYITPIRTLSNYSDKCLKHFLFFSWIHTT